MKVPVRPIFRSGQILAGGANGRRLFEELWQKAIEAPDSDTILIDFSGVSVATSSFLREGILVFRDRIRRERPDLYPIPVNLSADVREELNGLLNQVGEAMWISSTKQGKGVDGRALLGRIDGKLREALNLVEARGATDASSLWHRLSRSEEVGITAWNNRLAALSRQGLIREERVGKKKTYRPLRMTEV